MARANASAGLPAAILELAARDLRRRLGRQWRPTLELVVWILAELESPLVCLEVDDRHFGLLVEWRDWWRLVEQPQMAGWASSLSCGPHRLHVALTLGDANDPRISVRAMTWEDHTIGHSYVELAARLEARAASTKRGAA